MTPQERVVAHLRDRVDRWRGFGLGAAADPYPEDAPLYAPTSSDEQAVSGTTMALLQHWFRQEPHVLGVEPHTTAFKYWPHQRRLVETFIYLHEVVRVRRTEELYRFCGLEAADRQRDPWPKLGGQLATGSGKTKMMSLIIAWSYLNAVCEGEEHLGLGRHAILIAPGLFVRDRLLQDFKPPRGQSSVFFGDPVIPPELATSWDLDVFDPETCPLKLDPARGALVVTNYHQLLRGREEIPRFETAADRQIQLLFEASDPEKLEAIASPLVERFSRSRGLLVLNDEAHHVWDEPGHLQFEERARQRAAASEEDEDEQEAMAWIRSIRKLNGDAGRPGRVGLQVDMSATLFQETGTQRKPARARKGAPAAAQFKPTEFFRHTAVTYGLAEAIRDGIVKKPILERVEVKNQRTGEILPLVQEAAPNAWEKYRNLLTTGIQRWKKVQHQLEGEGDRRKPILFVLCNDRKEAAQVANFLAYGEASEEDLLRTGAQVTGYPDPDGGEPLFVSRGPDGGARSTVVQIHIGRKEESNEVEWEKVRAVVNAIDRDEIPDPSGALDEEGAPRMLPNPYNVVVSVMMLKEGWDVRNVKVIVPLRPCDSRTLTEQTLGRGLRKMHAPEIDDEGAALLKSEELYVIEHPSFAAILQQIQDIIEEKRSDEIDHPREYVPIPPLDEPADREDVDVRLARLEGVRHGARDWRRDVDVSRMPGLTPRLPWHERLDGTLIQTWLRKALEAGEQEGQTFTLPSDPSYRDFDHVLEQAYAVPILKELRASYQHKTAVKGVVQEFLETRTFALPASLPVSFEKVIAAGNGAIALGNLARAEVVSGVREALLGPLARAIQESQSAATAEISVRHASAIGGYQALNQFVLEQLRKSPFQRAATANPDELRVAALLEAARDVVGWVYNHRSGVGYSIPYMWQGRSARYFPDFIARARWGAVFHNFILEVKGRLDDRDKEKARRGRHWCEILTEHDVEPWHYLMLVENDDLQRLDIADWEGRSSKTLEDLLRRHEQLPLIPEGQRPPLTIATDVTPAERFRDAVPVYDLAVKAGSFGDPAEPQTVGWARLPGRVLDTDLFVAQVSGHSMEPGILDRAWGLFRSFPSGREPSLTGLDSRRVVVQLAEGIADSETGRFTLKRWRVTKRSSSGEVEEITLLPDNRDFPPIVLTPASGELRVVAEFLETVG